MTNKTLSQHDCQQDDTVSVEFIGKETAANYHALFVVSVVRNGQRLASGFNSAAKAMNWVKRHNLTVQ